ncbi:VWA domain-containing protein [Candidatus Woesearchaeota archaeon]|nr:VWA domain-containing protein [Candidatus Woesearchaeota archaeon]
MSRLEAFVTEVKRSVQDLPEHVRFGLVAYDRTVQPWEGEERAATGEAVTSASAWLDRITPGGSSGPARGMAYALRQYPTTDTFVLLTDGGPNVESNDVNLQMIRYVLSARSPARVHVFALDERPEPQDFLQSIASMTHGNYQLCIFR